MKGKFIISLDFELHWGGAEKWDLSKMQSYFLDTRKSIPYVLNLFEENGIEATWATVGFLFAKNKKQLLEFCPKNKPTYLNESLSYYNYFEEVGNDEIDDPFHFGYSLIQKILNTKGQELGTHTFEHYYCNENGQTIKQFEEDIIAAQSIAKHNFDIVLESLVFPRNQYNRQYLEIAFKHGIKVVRSNPNVYFWKDTYGRFKPILRAFDTLLPISSTLTFDDDVILNNEMIEIPASRFFRPFKNNEKIIQRLKLNRIKNEMTFAAKKGRNYHLWWHPHNFGENIIENHKQLIEIVKHFKYLEKEFDFKSVNMATFIKSIHK